MERLSGAGIKNYLTRNYGECRHNPDAMAIACRVVAKTHKVTPIKVFKFVVEGESIGHSHSYGFHTAYGRAIMNEFSGNYYKALRK